MSEKRYTYDELLKHSSLKKVEGIYKRTRWPGVFSYTGRNGIKFGIDYYVNGRQKREMVGPSLAEAKEKLAEIHAKVSKGEFVVNRKKFTFDQLREKYEEIYKGEPYFENSRKYYLKFLQGYFGGMKLYQISPFDIEQYRVKRKGTLTQHGKERSGVSVNREMECARHLFNKGVEWQMMEKSPFDRFKNKSSIIFPEDRGRLRFLDEGEIWRLLAVCPKYLRDIVEADLLCGLRKSDLLNLKWPDINLQTGVLTYSERKKGNRKVTKVLNSDMIELLMKIPKKQDDYVFRGPHGEAPLKDVARSFRTALRKAGIEGFTFHGLRHTFASHLAMRGASMSAIKEELAHSNLTTTQRYAHLSPGYLKGQIELLSGLCSERPSDEKTMRSGGNAQVTVNEEGYANA